MSSVEDELRLDAEELREAARRLLADKVDRRAGWEGREAVAAALDQEIGALGWYQLNAPEAQGGLGQSFDVLTPIYEELGRSLAPIWLSGTLATIDALRQEGTGEAEVVLAAALENCWRICIVWLQAGQSLASASVPMVAGAPEATHILFAAEDGTVALVARDAMGLRVTPVDTWDRGRSWAAVDCTGVSETIIKLQDVQVLAVLRAHSELALAWDSLGGAAQCLAETVDYMLGRHQFGRPIASFQALKHRVADHKVAIDLARALAVHASAQFADRKAEWSVLATQARLLAGEAYAAMAEDSVQLFGGVGFTWEYSPHLFLKRALVNQILGGSPEELRDKVAVEVCQKAFTTVA
jgi:alkylation response protein AidB-like acyl-CoA dehydrogenase